MSKWGWGIIFDKWTTGWQFALDESLLYIIALKRKAVLFGLKSLCNHLRQTHLKVLSDSTTSVCAINNMGSLQIIFVWSGSEQNMELGHWKKCFYYCGSYSWYSQCRGGPGIKKIRTKNRMEVTWFYLWLYAKISGILPVSWFVCIQNKSPTPLLIDQTQNLKR